MLGRVFDHFGVTGAVAAITAGWQEREDEDQALRRAAGGREVVNLRLHARAEEVFRADPELFEAHRAKQDMLRQYQELYRQRLHHAMSAASHMQSLATASVYEHHGVPRRGELVAAHLTGAIAAVRDLDDEHAGMVRDVERAFERSHRPAERAAVRRHRDEISAAISGAAAVAVAGGHVAVLLNRIRLFDLAPVLADKLVIAWSAGAMVVCERLVLFHDTPPQGRGYAEVLANGLGLCTGVVALPHARRRLLLDDGQRVSLLARRFDPALCATLDAGCALARQPDGTWRASGSTRCLYPDGTCSPLPGPSLDLAPAGDGDARSKEVTP